MGPEFLSSAGAGVWRKAPVAFLDSRSVLDKFLSAIVVSFGDIQAVDSEFPYQVPIVDRGTPVCRPHFPFL